MTEPQTGSQIAKLKSTAGKTDLLHPHLSGLAGWLGFA
jgi:hypothetical protein